jgi:AraC family transcriptional regulator
MQKSVSAEGGPGACACVHTRSSSIRFGGAVLTPLEVDRGPQNCYGCVMGDEEKDCARERGERPAGAPRARRLGGGEGWSVGEFTCRLGPQDRPFEERHDHATIAAVIEGTFQYRTATGTALLYPGAFLLGNAGACFECGHEHSVGDRCVSFRFDQPLFEEIAAAVAGSYRFRFSTGMLPAMPQLAATLVKLATGMSGKIALEERALRLAETVLATVAGHAQSAATPSSRDLRRISRVLRYIEEHADEPVDLADLAGVACMSKYHFLRTFRRTVGVTPHQFLLDLRTRRAAIALCTTSMPIAAIAFDAGFGDLSAFNARFRRVFGMSPGQWRAS